MNTNLEPYLTRLLPPNKAWINDLEQLAKEEKVPIMEHSAIHFLCQLVGMIEPKRILEIGTGIGYSALRMLDAYEETSIVTIERDEKRCQQAKQIVKEHTKDDHIKVLHGDACDLLQTMKEKEFDLIFIDAAKGQYQRYFELSYPLVANRGLIISDNVLFRGYVLNPAKAPKRFKNLVTKLTAYNKWLMNHPDFVTSILPLGDGVALSYKK